MTDFFTSDYHFFHNNILKYCDRPFKSEVEMRKEIIRRHNVGVDVNNFYPVTLDQIHKEISKGNN